MELYLAFRGRDPDIDALLRHRGLARSLAMRATRPCGSLFMLRAICCAAVSTAAIFFKRAGIAGLAAALPVQVLGGGGRLRSDAVSCIDPRMVTPVYNYMENAASAANTASS